jgi:hypothetical protein
MDRDRRLTGYLRGQTDNPSAPAGFELNNPWRVSGEISLLIVIPLTLCSTAREAHHLGRSDDSANVHTSRGVEEYQRFKLDSFSASIVDTPCDLLQILFSRSLAFRPWNPPLILTFLSSLRMPRELWYIQSLSQPLRLSQFGLKFPNRRTDFSHHLDSLSALSIVPGFLTSLVLQARFQTTSQALPTYPTHRYTPLRPLYFL